MCYSSDRPGDAVIRAGRHDGPLVDAVLPVAVLPEAGGYLPLPGRVPHGIGSIPATQLGNHGVDGSVQSLDGCVVHALGVVSDIRGQIPPSNDSQVCHQLVRWGIAGGRVLWRVQLVLQLVLHAPSDIELLASISSPLVLQHHALVETREGELVQHVEKRVVQPVATETKGGGPIRHGRVYVVHTVHEGDVVLNAARRTEHAEKLRERGQNPFAQQCVPRGVRGRDLSTVGCPARGGHRGVPRHQSA